MVNIFILNVSTLHLSHLQKNAMYFKKANYLQARCLSIITFLPKSITPKFIRRLTHYCREKVFKSIKFVCLLFALTFILCMAIKIVISRPLISCKVLRSKSIV